MTLFVCQQGRGFSTNRLSTLWRTALLLAIHLASRPVYNVERASRSALPSFWCLWIGKRAKTGRRTAPVYSNNGCPQSVAAWTHNKSDSVKNKYVSNASHLLLFFSHIRPAENGGTQWIFFFYLVRVVVPALFSVPEPRGLQRITRTTCKSKYILWQCLTEK